MKAIINLPQDSVLFEKAFNGHTVKVVWMSETQIEVEILHNENTFRALISLEYVLIVDFQKEYKRAKKRMDGDISFEYTVYRPLEAYRMIHAIQL